MSSRSGVDGPQMIQIADDSNVIVEGNAIRRTLALRINAHNAYRTTIYADDLITYVDISYPYPASRSQHRCVNIKSLASASRRGDEHGAPLGQVLRRLDLEGVQRERLRGQELVHERRELLRQLARQAHLRRQWPQLFAPPTLITPRGAPLRVRAPSRLELARAHVFSALPALPRRLVRMLAHSSTLPLRRLFMSACSDARLRPCGAAAARRRPAARAAAPGRCAPGWAYACGSRRPS
jgi:hypothetical protein